MSMSCIKIPWRVYMYTRNPHIAISCMCYSLIYMYIGPGPSPPVRLHGFNRTTFSFCCLGIRPNLLYRCFFWHYVTYVTCTSYMYIHASALILHTTTFGDQCLICYRTHQHIISSMYKVTKLLAVPLKMTIIAYVRESIPSLPDEPMHAPS